VLTLAEFAFFGNLFKSCAIARIKGKPPLGGNAATLVLRGNVTLTVNIALSETVAEFSAVVRIQ
jgi:hypothetical protein